MSKPLPVKKPRLTLFVIAQILATFSSLLLLSACGASDPRQTVHASTADLAFPGDVDSATASITSEWITAVDRLSGTYYGELERQIQGTSWMRTPYHLHIGRKNVRLPDGRVASYADITLDIAASGSLPGVHVESLLATQPGYQYSTLGTSEPALSFTTKVMNVPELSAASTFIQIVLPAGGVQDPTRNQIRIYGCGSASVGYCVTNTLAPDVRFVTALMKR
jgi:hypothetical protein